MTQPIHCKSHLSFMNKLKKMKYQLTVILSLSIAFLSGCKKEIIEDNDTMPWKPDIIAKRIGNSVELYFSQPLYYFNETALFPERNYASPLYFKVLISNTGIDHWNNYGNYDNNGNKTKIINISNLTKNKPYYFKAISVAKNGKTNESEPVMTIPGIPNLSSKEIDNIMEDRYSHMYSSNKTFKTYDRFYTWSPNHGVTSVFIRNAETSEEILIEKHSFSPAWSPEKNIIAYKSENILIENENGFDRPSLVTIYEMENDTIIRLTESNFSLDLSWSHDANWITFISDFNKGNEYNIWKINIHTKEKKLILGDIGGLDDLAIKIVRSPRNPVFSSDNSEIIFTRRTNNSRYKPFNLFSVSSSSGEVKEIIHSYWDDTSPNSSDDGKFISFISNRTGENQTWCITKKTMELFQLTDN